LSITYNNFINGKWEPSLSGKTYKSINPANIEEVLGHFQTSTSEDIEKAIKAAKDAFADWSATPAPKRGNVIFNLIQLLENNKEDLATVITKEVGKSFREANGEVDKTIEAMKQFSGEATRIAGETIPAHADGVFAYTIREPLGVVGVISPYNFPLGIGIWKIAPAIIAGNTVVFKPASNTSLISIKIMELFKKAGVPAGVINMVTGSGSVIGSSLGKHPDLKAISFTGSTDVGFALHKQVTERGGRMQAEMGGKNPSIVLEDANLDETVENLVQSSFYDNGQRCTGTSRVIVLRSIAEELIDKLKKRTNKIKVGNGFQADVDNGPVIDENQLNKFLYYVNSALEEGATLEFGGKRETRKDMEKGYFVVPTIFSNVTRDMAIYHEEVFAPIISITVVDSYEEAIDLANDNNFGLSSTIYTNDLSKSMSFIKRIESGVTHVNVPSNYFENQFPFGGKKSSSIGPREQGSTALDFWLDYKTVYLKG